MEEKVYYPEIKLIDENTDISKLNIKKYNWDVWLGKNFLEPYTVCKIEGYVHSVCGIYNGGNDLWAFPRGEKPSYDNLIEYDSKVYGACWGIKYEPYIGYDFHHDETSATDCKGISITRNGETFYSRCYSIADALTTIDKFNDHPLGFNFIDYDTNMIGMKIFYRSEPGIIKKFLKGSACIIISPDGINKFSRPKEYSDDDLFMDDDEIDIVTSVLDEHVCWFRD